MRIVIKEALGIKCEKDSNYSELYKFMTKTEKFKFLQKTLYFRNLLI